MDKWGTGYGQLGLFLNRCEVSPPDQKFIFGQLRTAF